MARHLTVPGHQQTQYWLQIFSCTSYHDGLIQRRSALRTKGYLLCINSLIWNHYISELFQLKNLWRTYEITGLGSNTFYQIQIQIQIHFFRSFKYKYKYKYTGENLIKYKYKYKYSSSNTNTNTNTQWGRDKIAAILQMTYWNLLYCKKIVYTFKFHWKLFPRSNLQ